MKIWWHYKCIINTSTVKLLYTNCSKSLIIFSYGGQRDNIMNNKELYVCLGAVFFFKFTKDINLLSESTISMSSIIMSV